MHATLEHALQICAAQARMHYPGEARRINKGFALALNDAVQPGTGGIMHVRSESDAEIVYNVGSTFCDCRDSLNAPERRCKHVWACVLLAHAFKQEQLIQEEDKESTFFDSQSQVLGKADDRYIMSSNEVTHEQTEDSMSDKAPVLQPIALYTTAPACLDFATTTETAESFTYGKENMRKVLVAEKKALTQQHAYDRKKIYFTCTEDKATILMKKEVIMAKQVLGGTEHSVAADEVTKRNKRSKNTTTTSTRANGTVVHVTAPENEAVQPEPEPVIVVHMKRPAQKNSASMPLCNAAMTVHDTLTTYLLQITCDACKALTETPATPELAETKPAPVDPEPPAAPAKRARKGKKAVETEPTPEPVAQVETETAPAPEPEPVQHPAFAAIADVLREYAQLGDLQLVHTVNAIIRVLPAAPAAAAAAAATPREKTAKSPSFTRAASFEPTQALADQIRALHAAGGKSQKQVAEAVGCTKLFVWEVLNDIRFTENPNPRFTYSRKGK